MGRTLFWYVFKDLLRIFGMTAGTLSAVMSFGGLLRPLTQHGLGLGQVGQMLAYFSPAMTAYALPIAALFAATVVYGRLSADNELTACRAGGVSLGPLSGMALPAAVFGVLVALLSLVLLCFVVPTYTLKVERVIYSNLAKLISNKIERTHEMRFGEANIFADRAYVPPPDPANPDRQRVVLEGVSIVQYERVPDKPVAAEVANLNPAAAELFADDNAVTLRGRFTKVPKEFLLASSATIEISEREDDQLTVLIALEGGTKFPREFRGGMQAGIEAVQFGPLEVPSPIKEDPKFMDVERLRELYKKPEKSRKIQSVMGEFIRRDQVARSVNELVRRLGPSAAATQPAPPRRPGRPAGAATQPSPGDSALVDFGAGRFVELRGANGSVIRISVDPTAPGAIVSPEGDEVSVTGASPSTIWFERIDPPPAGAGPEAGTEWSVQAARALRIRVRPDQPRQRMHLTVELLDRSPGGIGTSMTLE